MTASTICRHALTVLALLLGAPDNNDGADKAAPEAADDLEMTVTRPDDPASHKVLVALHNRGERDLVLNLGIMLANGKKQFPTALRLDVTDGKGATRQLRISEPGVAGRVDDFAVPLCTGATYTVALDLDRMHSDNPAEAGRALSKGAYRVVATFEGKNAQHINSDLKGIALMEFWTAKVESKPVGIDLR